MRVMNVPLHSGIEVNGRAIPAALEAFGQFTVLAGQMLMAHGIGKPDKNGFIQVDMESWYPLESYLQMYKDIAEQLGDALVRKLGVTKAKHAQFPGNLVDVPSAMKAIDASFHLSHRHHGRVMFDPVSGKMLEGIGHYHCQHVPGTQRVLMRCDNPYPCEFDQGLIESLAQRFAPGATLAHEPLSPCRKRGATSCNYLVTW